MNTIISNEKLEYMIKKNDNRPALLNLEGKSNLVGLEIGTQYGYNAYNILSKYDIQTLYLIDPYEDDYSLEHYIELNSMFVLKDYEDKIVRIKKRSEDAVDDIPDNLDFIYIDGDHRYECIKRDIELYYPKVKISGLFAGHDYKKSELGVVQAVNEFFGRGNFEQDNWDWWVIKR